jgi:hypothetical protein
LLALGLSLPWFVRALVFPTLLHLNHARHDSGEDEACTMKHGRRKPGQPTVKAARGIRAWGAKLSSTLSLSILGFTVPSPQTTYGRCTVQPIPGHARSIFICCTGPPLDGRTCFCLTCGRYQWISRRVGRIWSWHSEGNGNESGRGHDVRCRARGWTPQLMMLCTVPPPLCLWDNKSDVTRIKDSEGGRGSPCLSLLLRKLHKYLLPLFSLPPSSYLDPSSLPEIPAPKLTLPSSESLSSFPD